MNRLKRLEYEYLCTQVFDELKKYEILYYLPYLNRTTHYRIVRKMSKPNWKAKTRKYLLDLDTHHKKKRKKK
jgi:hypothetical protein